MLLDLVALLVDLHDRSPRTLRRHLAKADAAGLPLVFDGSVVGETDYCHDESGVFELTGSDLVWREDVDDEESFPVPVERLAVREVVTKRRRVQVSCLDGGQAVTLTCPRYAVGYLARVVPGLQLLLDVPGSGAAVR